MDRLFVVVIPIAIMIIGYVRQSRTIQKLKHDKAFAEEFLENFRLLVEKSATNEVSGVYEWLISKMDKIQAQIGTYGVYDLKPAFANHIYTNYPIIVNTIPRIIRGQAHYEDQASCIESMLRYLGHMDDTINELTKANRNPLLWLREGTRLLVLSPLFLLSWAGLINSSFVLKVQNGYASKFISGIIIIVGLIGSIFTIVLGWDQVLKLLHIQ